MARKPEDFVRTNTTTKKKIQINEWTRDLVNRHYPNGFGGKCVSLPGRGPQLERHIIEMMNWKVDPKKIIFVDRAKNVVRSLKRSAGIIGWTGEIKHENIFTTIRNIWDAGDHISCIDFDGTGHLTRQHIKLIEDACTRKTEVINIVLSTRISKLSKYLYGWKCRLGLSVDDNDGNQPCKLIQQDAIDEIARKYGYLLWSEGYRGRSPMLACVLIKP